MSSFALWTSLVLGAFLAIRLIRSNLRSQRISARRAAFTPSPIVSSTSGDSNSEDSDPKPTPKPKQTERVLVIGASSGVGREIALQYAARGARVAIVGRRQAALDGVLDDCVVSVNPTGPEDVLEERSMTCEKGFVHRSWGTQESLGNRKDGFKARYFAVVADCAEPSGVEHVWDAVHAKWGGLDTLVIAAGVSTVRMYMESVITPTVKSPNPVTAALERSKALGTQAMAGNFLAPMLVTTAFIPMLQKTSPSPSITVLSSVAALIPAPSRTLYAASKSASLLFFQALSIEHPRINFSLILPGTIEGSFQSSAIDLTPEFPPPRKPVDIDEAELGGKGGVEGRLRNKLKKEEVARRTIEAADAGDRIVWMPWWYRWAHVLYWDVPSLIKWGAKRKYGIK